ncbi:unnamed protein product, partial [Citrullus colocynthis]
MKRRVNDQPIYKGKEKITVGCDQKKMSAPLFSTSSSKYSQKIVNHAERVWGVSSL